MLTNTFSAAQAFLVSAVFLVAGGSKLWTRSAKLVEAETPLTRFLPPRVVPGVWGTLGALELGLAAAVVVPTTSQISLAVSAGLLMFFAALQSWIASVTPGAPCGCFGARAEEAVSKWTILRTGLLAVAAVGGAVTGGTSGADSSDVLRAIALASVEGVLLASCSATLRERALASIRSRQLVRDCATIRVPLEVTLAALRGSDAWGRWLPHLSEAEEVRDHWRSGCWRFVSFDADYQGRTAVAVFAARVLDRHPEIRVALVDGESDVVLASEGSTGPLGAATPAAPATVGGKLR